jgi:hypothetical protein
MENTNQTYAKEKAIAIIDSCFRCEQFDNAITFIDLFYKQFKDENEYKLLLDILKKKKIEINCHE